LQVPIREKKGKGKKKRGKRKGSLPPYFTFAPSARREKKKNRKSLKGGEGGGKGEKEGIGTSAT